MRQHPLVTLRNDAVGEKQLLSGQLSPAPPHAHTRTPGSSKPQLDRPFAGGEKTQSVGPSTEIASRGSCSEFSSLKIKLCAWWHPWENPGAGVGGEILQPLPAWLGAHVEQGPGGEILHALFLLSPSLLNRRILPG